MGSGKGHYVWFEIQNLLDSMTLKASWETFDSVGENAPQLGAFRAPSNPINCGEPVARIQCLRVPVEPGPSVGEQLLVMFHVSAFAREKSCNLGECSIRFLAGRFRSQYIP